MVASLHCKGISLLMHCSNFLPPSSLLENPSGGIIPVSSFRGAAIGACLDQNRHIDHPFLCFDLTYIYALLYHGFGLNVSLIPLL